MRLFSSFVILVLLFIQVKAQSPAKAVFLRCEYLENPLGIDAANPRLTWRMEDSRQGAVQTGFEIWVDKDSLALLNGTAQSWNQKKILGDANLILYAGKKLEPFTKYYWRVFIWDREVGGLRALDSDAASMPASLEEAISERLQSTEED